MSHYTIATITSAILLIVAMMIGGWIWEGAKSLPKDLKKRHRSLSLFFFVSSTGTANRIRLNVPLQTEDWTVTLFRIALIVVGIAWLVLSAQADEEQYVKDE